MKSTYIPIAAAPFNDKNADITLRTSDGVHFYVHKATLSVASEFFRDIPTFPQDNGDLDDRERTVLDVPEDKYTLDLLLRFYYPGWDPIIADLFVCAKVLEAAIKYKMDETVDKIRKIIVKKFIPLEPLAVYGLASQPSISSETLARKAAEEWLKQKPTWIASHKFVHEGWLSGERFVTVEWEETSTAGSYDSHYMKRTTAGQYYRLLRFLRLPQHPFALLKNKAASLDNCLDSHNPLRSYFTAVSLGWEELARRSALAAAFYPVEHVYVPEMEQVPSLSYYSLMKYHHECQLVLSAFVQNHGPPKRKENIKLLRMLFSVPEDDETNESFVDRKWDCDSVVTLCYASSMVSKSKAFDQGEFQSMLTRLKIELERNLNEIVLDWHSAV